MHSHDDSRSSREADIDGTIDPESRRQSVPPGEADSAVGIAHRVNYIGLRSAFCIHISDLTNVLDRSAS